MQLDMFGNQLRRDKIHQLDCALDSIKRRYGNQVIMHGIVLAEPSIAQIDPKDDHTIHPQPFFSG